MKTIKKTIAVITLLTICIMSCMAYTLNRGPTSSMFPEMSHLEVYNSGLCIAEYDGQITVKMGSLVNQNVYGHDFVLEYYEVYVNGNYVETFIDSDAMAFKYTKRER